MSSPPLMANEALSSPPQLGKPKTHITPVKRRSSARLSQIPLQRTPSLSDSPIPVLTPPTRAPERRETPRKTPRSVQRPTGVTKQSKRPTKTRPAALKKRNSAALAKAYSKDEKLNHPRTSTNLAKEALDSPIKQSETQK